MNLLHLKYLIEIEKRGSISKAADALYMNQPHLSKIVKEMEEQVNFKIFERSSKGAKVTAKGKAFLSDAKVMMSHIDKFESSYQNNYQTEYALNVCVPRASYVFEAFLKFLNQGSLDNREVKINYQETNTQRVMKNVFQGDDDLGIIRFPKEDLTYYQNILSLKELEYKILFRFEYRALMSAHNSLADKHINLSDLSNQIELIHGDVRYAEMPLSLTNHLQDEVNSSRVIHIYERASQFDILRQITESYMWVSPMPSRIMDQFDLVQKSCKGFHNQYLDLLIYRKGYQKSKEDKLFIQELEKMVKEI